MYIYIIYKYKYKYIYLYICCAKNFLDSRYKVGFAWDLNQKPLDFCSDALPNELMSMTQGWSFTVDAYTRSDIEAHRSMTGF